MVIITGYADWAENAGGFPDGYYSRAVTNDMLGCQRKGFGADFICRRGGYCTKYTESHDYIRTTGYDKNGVVTDRENDEDYMGYKLNI